ncbi:MAG: endoribonuclease MazF [Pseudomonadota bacterium]
MVTSVYIPDCGDVVWLDFTPQAGHEQAGRRPALVLSVASYNAASGLAICCPVTNQAKGYPFEVPAAVPSKFQLTGVVLADHVRSVDWRARNARKFAEVTPQCANDVSKRIKLLLP